MAAFIRTVDNASESASIVLPIRNVWLAQPFLRKAIVGNCRGQYGREETNTLALKKFTKAVTAFTGQVACKETRTFGKGRSNATDYIQRPKT
jgi:hypothetical protein